MLIVYTDGSCAPNPGRGGWGVLVCDADDVPLWGLSGGGDDMPTTNNRMELTAVIRALQALATLPVGHNVQLHTDSMYVLNGRKRTRPPKVNHDLWVALHDATVDVILRHRVTWHHVRGHADSEGNRLADTLANTGRESDVSEREWAAPSLAGVRTGTKRRRVRQTGGGA